MGCDGHVIVASPRGLSGRQYKMAVLRCFHLSKRKMKLFSIISLPVVLGASTPSQLDIFISALTGRFDNSKQLEREARFGAVIHPKAVHDK